MEKLLKKASDICNKIGYDNIDCLSIFGHGTTKSISIDGSNDRFKEFYGSIDSFEHSVEDGVFKINDGILFTLK